MLFGGESAESYYDEGVTASMKGNVTLAIEHFSRAIQLDNNYISARYQLAKCYARAGRIPAAIELLRQVIRTRPSQIPPRVDLAFILIDLGRIDDAQSLLKEVLGYKETHARAYIGLGLCSFAQERWKEAAVLANKAIEHGGANFNALFLLARAQKRAGNGEESMSSFKGADNLIQKLIESAPEQPEGYYLRGILLLAQDKITEALDHFQSAENRAAPEAYYASFGIQFNRLDIQAQRGICLQRLGRPKEAEALGRAILEQSADHSLAKQLCGEGESKS